MPDPDAQTTHWGDGMECCGALHQPDYEALAKRLEWQSDGWDFPGTDVREQIGQARKLFREAATALRSVVGKCGWCNGTGTGRVTVKAGLISAHGGDWPTTISGPCRECDGTGRALSSQSVP